MSLPPTGTKFPLIRPVMPPPEAWLPYLQTAYDRRYFTNFGPNEQLLSARLAERFGQPGGEVVLASSATAALTAALIAMDVHGTVIVPGFTFPATVQAVIAAGCRPLVLDVDPETWELSARDVEKAINLMPIAAIMPVRVFGFVRDQTDLVSVAERHGLPIIFDSAAALGHTRFPVGASYPRYVEVFSLHATKSFAVGEGGATLCSPKIAARIRKAMNFGLNEDRSFGDGLNGKMSEFQAAVGLAALDMLDPLLRRRREMAEFYEKLLRPLNSVSLAPETQNCPWAVYPVLTAPGTNVPALMEHAAVHGLQLRRYYHPSIRRGYRGSQSTPGYLANDLPVSELLSEHMICLPVYADVSDSEKTELSRIAGTLFGVA
jgi:dTDP-4-amino-4,6-dideoxygalactose transaminase